jgi:glycosyltransferase involved in cell wall biosynthesis
MTVFNAERFLSDSINSLLDQDFKDWELNVVENGSTDRSAEILSKFDDSRIVKRFLSNNIGRTKALNLALSESTAPYVAVLDADDLANRSRLSKEVYFLENNPHVGLVASWSLFIDDAGNLYAKHTPPETHRELIRCMATSNPFVHSSVMFRRSILDKVGNYEERFEYAQDFNLAFRIAKESGVAVIPDYLCSWRRTSGAMTTSISNRLVRSRDEAIVFEESSTIVEFGILNGFLNRKQKLLTRTILFFNLLLIHRVGDAIKVIIKGPHHI